MRFWKRLVASWRYDLASALSLTVVALLFAGKLTVDNAMGIVIAIVTLLVLDMRPQLERHKAEIAALLQDVLIAGQAARKHNVSAALQAGEVAVLDGAAVAEEVKAQTS